LRKEFEENAMNAPTSANDDSVFESFPEYHNFPLQWNLSEMDTPAKPARDEHGEQSARFPAAERTGVEASIPMGDAYPVFNRDPFPKLKTLPVYWDLSR
jgi:hypothetical protein